MRIALTVWEDRISPVFDAATTLLIVDLVEEGLTDRHLATLPRRGSAQQAGILKQLGVSILICGAISEGHANNIAFSGIELIPFISGKTENILEAFASGEPIIPAFSMPGCGGPCRRRMMKHEEVMNMPKKDGTGPAGKGPATGKARGGCRSGKVGGKGRGPGRGQGRKSGQNQDPRPE